MNIAFDTTPLYNNNKNRGVGKYTQKLVEELNKINSSTNPRPDLGPIQIIPFHKPGPIPPCDIIHYPYFDPFFLTLPLIKRYPTVVTIHDLIPLIFPKEFPIGLKGELKWQIQKQSLKSVKAIITDSENSKKDIIKFTGINSDKIHVVYLAPLLTDIKITEQEIKDFKAKRHLPDKFLLYVGDINYNKNIPNLYRAINILNHHCLPAQAGKKRSEEVEPQRNPAIGGTISLVLVGNSFFNDSLPEKKQLDELENNLNIGKSLIKLGSLTDKEIKILYNLATAYIQPSFYEGFGLPVIEAMSLGCPVICSDRASLPEVGGDAVLYINPQDPQNIAEGIEKILRLNEPERKVIIEKGKTQAQKFTWSKTAINTIRVYNEVLKYS